MKVKLFKNWWLASMKGIIALIIGIITLIYPDVALLTVVTLFGIFAIAGGVLIISASLLNKENNANWKFWLFEGIIDVLIGIALASFPERSASILMIFIAIWAFIAGVTQLVTFFKLKEFKMNRPIIFINSLLLLLFGFFLISNPFEGGITLTIIFGIFLVLFGLLTIMSSIRLSRF
jgi:uncharacterized membrane protein HdeD (DUF308 family)